MLPPKLPGSPEQQRLLKLFRQLSDIDRESVISFAAFLAEQTRSPGGEPAGEQKPADIPRPESESVVAAMRRLTKTFYMLNKDELLHEASALMTAHVMQGRPAVAVIDELEVLFRQHYERVNSAS